MQIKAFISKIIVFFLIAATLSTSAQANTVYAASLKFYNYSTGSKENYTGKQVIYTYNSRKLPLTYPGILINGTALADYEELFVQELGLTADRTGDTITITDGNAELVLIMGSKTVIKDGEVDTMSVAPVKLKFDDSIKYYVPTRYVAEFFGFGYVWVSSTSTVKITKTLHLSANEIPFTYNGTLYSVNYLEQRIATDMPVIYYQGNVIVPAQQVFETAGCTYTETDTKLKITKDELSLIMDITGKTAYVNEKKIIADVPPITITDMSSGNSATYIPLEFVTELLGFSLTYSDEERCYSIRDDVFTGSLELYPDLKYNLWEQETTEEQQQKNSYFEWISGENDINSEKHLSKVLAYSTEHADVIELYGISRENITDFWDNGLVVFELDSVYTNMETQYFADFSSSHLTYALLTCLGNDTKLFFMISPEDEWTFVEQPDCVQVYFAHADLSTELFLSSSNRYPDDKVIIPLHETVDGALIYDQDNYLNHNFKLYIPGNHVDFYTQNYIINPYYSVENPDVYYDKTTDYTVLTFNTKSICGYKYTVENGCLFVTVGKPNEIFSKILVLDAGHGGIDPGASKSGIKEKDLNFIILNTYVKELFEDSDIKVYFTRETDVKIDLYDRAAFASEVGADMFISLHMNSNNSSSVNGTEVYYSKDNNTTLENGFNSYQLAKALVNNLSLSMGTKNRGVSKAEFVVVKYNTVPAVLIELGFMTNTKDLSKLKNTTYQKKAAETIYQTVIQLFDTCFLR